MKTEYKCMICEDTGSFHQNGLLDCGAPSCTAAVDRTELNAFIASHGGLHAHTLDDMAWMIHQRAVEITEQKEPKRRAEDK